MIEREWTSFPLASNPNEISNKLNCTYVTILPVDKIGVTELTDTTKCKAKALFSTTQNWTSSRIFLRPYNKANNHKLQNATDDHADGASKCTGNRSPSTGSSIHAPKNSDFMLLSSGAP